MAALKCHRLAQGSACSVQKRGSRKLPWLGGGGNRLLVFSKNSTCCILACSEGWLFATNPSVLLIHDLYFVFIQHFLPFLRAPAAETAQSCHTAVSAESGV